MTVKLGPTEVRLIRADPRPNKVVAYDFGVHRSTVAKARAGSAWSDSQREPLLDTIDGPGMSYHPIPHKRDRQE